MKAEKFILKIIKTLESMKDSMFVFSYKESNVTKTSTWWVISVSDFEFYMHDSKFKNLSKSWSKIAKSYNMKIVFVCGWIPTEERLLELANYNNLVLNV